jgi:hypothetical protein
MNTEYFRVKVEEAFQRSRNVLERKASHYSVEGDRLGQFYRIAARSAEGRINPVQALVNLMEKHFDTILLKAKNFADWTLEEWQENTTDLRNYTLLLDALLEDLKIGAEIPKRPSVVSMEPD